MWIETEMKTGSPVARAESVHKDIEMKAGSPVRL